MSVCRVYVISGTFRAFDRRPLGTAIIEPVDEQQDGQENIVTRASPSADYMIIENAGVSTSETMMHHAAPLFIENAGISSSETMRHHAAPLFVENASVSSSETIMHHSAPLFRDE